MAVFECTGAISVAWPQVGHRRGWSLHWLRIHLIFPVYPVTILDTKHDRRSKRMAVPYSREYFDGVMLNLHPAASPISTLATAHLLIYSLFMDWYS
jgi:hypothetical protein